jgi:O-antigen/teichoic acid export membrane protein
MAEYKHSTRRAGADNERIHAKIYTGSAWMVLTRLAVKSLGLISSVVLARLLLPEDFGLVAIAMAIYALVELFGAFGFGDALIQRQSPSEEDYNTAWTFKVIFGCFAAACLVLLAPAVAAFYEEPRLKTVIWVIAAASIFSGAVNIGTVNFQREMDFRRELQLQLVPKLISFCITVSLAFLLRNYWALVLGTVASQVVVLVYSFLMHPFRPRFSLQSFNGLFSFSRWILLNNLLTFLNERASELLVGKALSTSAVGLFSLSKEISQLPTAEVAKPINKATFPVYARFQDNFIELRRAYLSTVALTAALTLPAALGIACVAPLLVQVVLGEQWLAMVPLLQLLAIASLLASTTLNNGYVYMACGRPDLMVAINGARTLLFFTLLVPFLDVSGLLGIGHARLGATIAMLVVVQVIMSKFLQLSLRSFLSALLRPVAASTLMFAVLVLAKQHLVFLSPGGLLAVMIASGAFSYLLATLLLWWLQGRPEGIEQSVLQQIFSPGIMRG